jgi:DNA-binding protein H-NS
MEKLDLEGLPLDDLWALHEQITKVLSSRIIAQKQELEQRLLQLTQGRGGAAVSAGRKPTSGDGPRQRRSYPRVYPKYRNPSAPGETWSGRGKQPRWLVAALKAGGKMDDFVIPQQPVRKSRTRR